MEQQPQPARGHGKTSAKRQSTRRRAFDFVVRDAIIPALKATTREGALREIVESLRAAGQLGNAEVDDIVRAILRREMLCSTGIGRGVAMPHTQHPGVERLVGTVAVSLDGIPFDSLDGEPVFVFVLLISPPDRPGDHLRALENIARSLRDERLVWRLCLCETRDAIWALLEDANNWQSPVRAWPHSADWVDGVAGGATFLPVVSPAMPTPAQEPPVRLAESVIVSEGARLTAPHLCGQCGGNLPATGRRRTSRVHCPHCCKPTSVYAILHRCPTCDVLLESPLRERERLSHCSACGVELTVPSDILFNDTRERPDHTWFAFPCPNCKQELSTPPAGANRIAVCPHCQRPLTIPVGGEPACEKKQLSAHPQPNGLRRCPHCGLQVAARARVCRNCDTRLV